MRRTRLAVIIIAGILALLVADRFLDQPPDAGPMQASPGRLSAGSPPSRRVAARHYIPAGPVAAPRTPPSDAPAYAPGQVLVTFVPGTPQPVIDELVERIGGTVIKTYRKPGLFLVQLPESMTVTEAERYFADNDHVERVEKDLVYHLMDIPNDPQFGELWGLDNTGQAGGVADVDINAPEAWVEVTGSRDFVIAVIDSGAGLDHPDLAANLWANPGEVAANGIDDDGNGYVDDIHGIDQIEFDGVPNDELGHGTHVAGTIAAAGNNGIGVAGVMWEANVLSCKAFSRLGWTTLSRILTCMDYVAWASDAGYGVVAVNASWGGAGFSWSLHDAVAELAARDILFVVSAGNIGSDIDRNPVYPAAYDFENVVSVAAINRFGELAEFSNYGAAHVDIAAPGVDILSTEPEGRWGYKSGTSMAAPHVTGAIGIIKASAPAMTGQEIKAHLMASGAANPTLAGRTVSGRHLRLVLPFVDLDGDLVSDRWERRYGLDPANPADAAQDADADGLDNLAEYTAKTDPTRADTDGDVLNDGDELNVHGTSPLAADSDGDGLDDAGEVLTHGTDPNLADTDADGLGDKGEIDSTGSDPLAADTDGDGLLDGFEAEHELDPLAAGEERLDTDSDGLTTLEEQAAATDPANPDTDGDTLGDGDEINTHQTNPLDTDTDGDQVSDDWEIGNAMLPADPGDQRLDPDADGYTNLEEFFANSNPRDVSSVPAALRWSGRQGNARHSGFVPIHTSAADFETRWVAKLPRPSDRLPSGTRDAGYHISESQTLVKYSIANGEPVWTASIEGNNPRQISVGEESVFVTAQSPVIFEGWRLLAWDRATGEPLYEPVLLDDWGGSRAVDDGEIFIGGAKGLLKLDARSGTELWQTPADLSGALLAVDDRFVVAASPSRARIFDRATGVLRHEVNIPGCEVGPEDIALDGDGYAYVLCPFGLTRIRPADGVIEWQVWGARGISSLAVDARHVYVSNWESLYALDRETGGVAWQWASPGRTDGNIVVTLDHVFMGVWANGGGRPLRTVAIDLDTHEQVWETDLPGALGMTGDGALLIMPGTADVFAVVDTRGDLDADGLKDWWERFHGLDFADPADAGLDPDGDGLSNAQEKLAGSDPQRADTDADGLGDGVEVNGAGSDPLLADSDSDGLADGDEVNVYGTLPGNTDSDGDGYQDGDEAGNHGTDPADANSFPEQLRTFAESFESGIPSEWDNGAAADHAFVRAGSDASDGFASLASPPMPKFETVAIEWQENFAAGDLAFDYRIANGGAYGAIRVNIDGVVTSFAASETWKTARIAIASGYHTVRFEYDASSNDASPVAFIDNVRFGPAPPFGSSAGNVLVVVNNRLHEFRPDGTQARSSVAIPHAIDARDLAVLPDHRIVISDAPYLHIYDPALKRFSIAKVEDWRFGSNISSAPIAVAGDDILVSMDGRLMNRLDGNGVLRESLLANYSYVRMQMGHDGYLYAQPNFDGLYDRMDPVSLQTLQSVRLQGLDSRGLAVTASGDLYSVSFGRRIEKYSADGVLLNSRRLLTSTWPHDLALTEYGMLFAGSIDGELMIVDQDFRQQEFVTVSDRSSFIESVFVASIPSAGPDTDGDELPDWWERARGLDLSNAGDALGDPDADGLNNAGEFAADGDPFDADTDDDGLADGEEARDGSSSVTDVDTDRDGLPDFEEVKVHGTNPRVPDSDGDGLPDHAELRRYGSDPLRADTDGDGLGDGEELRHHLSMTDATDAAADFDGDGLSNVAELAAGIDLRSWDSDDDGLADGEEVNAIGTSPLNPDSDADRMRDGWERRFGLDPLSAADAGQDPDGDGFVNRVEYYASSAPGRAVSVPVPTPWHTDQGGAGHTGYVPVRLDPTGFSVAWSANAEPGMRAYQRQAAIGRDRVFVAQQNHPHYALTAFNRWTGEIEWQRVFGGVSGVSGPAIDHDTVYVQTGYRDDNYIWGIRQEDGGLRFQAPYGPYVTHVRAPVIVGNGLYTSIGMDGGVGRFNTDTGNLVWYAETRSDDDNNAPTVVDGHVYTYSPDKDMLNVIDAGTGAHGYSIWNSQGGSNVMNFGSAMTGSSGNLIVNEGGQFVSIDLEGKKVNWTAPVASYKAAAIANGVIYAVEPNALVAIDERDGSVLWRWPTMRNIVSDVVVTADHAFVATDAETFAIDTATAKSDWSYPAGGQLSMSADQVLYIAGHDSIVTAIATQADSDGDHVPDNWEQRFGFEPNDSSDAQTDADKDGLSQRDEYLARTNPRAADSDGDGFADPDELEARGTRPLSADSDGDGITDGDEVRTWGTDPLATDSDADGLPDDREISVYGTNPAATDSDGDGWNDALEIRRRSDPARRASTPPPVEDFIESFEGGGMSPRFRNGSSKLNGWELSDDGDAVDGRYFIRSTFVDSEMATEFTWEDLFADGILTYRVKVEDMNCCDTLRVYLDGQLVETIDQPQAWREHFIRMTPGRHVIRWRSIRSPGSGTRPSRTMIDLIRYSGPDRDRDGMPTDWELTHGLDPEHGSDRSGDQDGDTLGNFEEFTAGTSPVSADTDDDGLPDPWELENSLDPVTADALGDPDEDGLSNVDEYSAGTRAQNPDTDGDRMPDGWEAAYDLDPLADDASADADDDGAGNLEEYEAGSNPQGSFSVPYDGSGGGGGGGGGGAIDLQSMFLLLLLSLLGRRHALLTDLRLPSRCRR